MLRLPRPTKDALDALSGATGTPIWRLIDAAVSDYIKNLPDTQRRLLTSIREHCFIGRLGRCFRVGHHDHVRPGDGCLQGERRNGNAACLRRA